MIPYYRAADLFFYFTELDAYPRALLEAKASGLAIICNAVGSIPEMIKNGESGYLIESPDDLILTAERLIQDESLRARIGKNAQESCQSTNSPDIIGKQWVKVLNQIISTC